jgi:hypothetical protein
MTQNSSPTYIKLFSSTETLLKVTVIRDVTMCYLVGMHRRFGGTCCFHLQISSTLNKETSGWFLPINNMTSQS